MFHNPGDPPGCEMEKKGHSEVETVAFTEPGKG